MDVESRTLRERGRNFNVSNMSSSSIIDGIVDVE